jgi:hypothetical protein
MDIDTEQLTGLLDREQIRDCIARLARGEDRRDARLIGGVLLAGRDDRSRDVRRVLR